MKKSNWAAGAILLLMSYHVFAQTNADLYAIPKMSTLQNRNYSSGDEITIQGGYLPLDPYTKFIGVGLVYTHAFSDFTAWEIVNANYSINLVSGLRRDLTENFAAQDAQFEQLQYYATTNLQFTPFYTKNLLFNSKIVHSQLAFIAGGGAMAYKSGVKPGIDLGLIFKYYLGEVMSLKLDIRHYTVLATEIRNNLALVVGLSFKISGFEEEAQEVKFDD
ncbi:MAG: outer membrane beta-barrel domain-containing protein [Oligoflexia bacterium]|nr:outer membrane beta-barrel domain-containing protein [Oligoflexia bacterium]